MPVAPLNGVWVNNNKKESTKGLYSNTSHKALSKSLSLLDTCLLKRVFVLTFSPSALVAHTEHNDPGIWSWEIKNRQSALHKQKCGKHLADKCVPGSRSPNQEFWLFVLTVCYFTMRLRICLSMDSMSNGQEGLACCSPWGCKESDMTEWLHWTDEVTAVDSRNSCHIDILRSKWDMERNKKPLRKKEIGGMAKMKWHQEVYLIPH